jgi:hypothetical protein
MRLGLVVFERLAAPEKERERSQKIVQMALYNRPDK